MIELDISFEWRRGIFARFRKHPDKYIETMPIPEGWETWRKGKTEEVNNWLKDKQRDDRLAKKDA